MGPILILILAVAGLLYYVFNLDFEIGTGFTEMKKKIREGTYTINDKEEDQDNLLE